MKSTLSQSLVPVLLSMLLIALPLAGCYTDLYLLTHHFVTQPYFDTARAAGITFTYTQ